jgi:protein-S-isoprenylcysteine O-methyltransferase Ste14
MESLEEVPAGLKAPPTPPSGNTCPYSLFLRSSNFPREGTIPMNKRAVVSLTLLFSLVMLPVSAIIIHATHGSKTSHTWLHLHAIFGLIFLIAGIFHAVDNWRTLKNYLKAKKLHS